MHMNCTIHLYVQCENIVQWRITPLCIVTQCTLGKWRLCMARTMPCTSQPRHTLMETQGSAIMGLERDDECLPRDFWLPLFPVARSLTIHARRISVPPCSWKYMKACVAHDLATVPNNPCTKDFCATMFMKIHEGVHSPWPSHCESQRPPWVYRQATLLRHHMH